MSRLDAIERIRAMALSENWPAGWRPALRSVAVRVFCTVRPTRSQLSLVEAVCTSLGHDGSNWGQHA